MQGKSEAKRKFRVYPSAYANAYAVRCKENRLQETWWWL